jgi:hypothetical protein
MGCGTYGRRTRRWCTRCRALFDGGRKAVSPGGHGNDVLVLAGFLPKRLAGHGNLLGEVGFVDEAVGPKSLHQLVFGDHPAAVFHQQQEEIVGLRGKRDRFGAAQQSVLESVQDEWPEFE